MWDPAMVGAPPQRHRAKMSLEALAQERRTLVTWRPSSGRRAANAVVSTELDAEPRYAREAQRKCLLAQHHGTHAPSTAHNGAAQTQLPSSQVAAREDEHCRIEQVPPVSLAHVVEVVVATAVPEAVHAPSAAH